MHKPILVPLFIICGLFAHAQNKVTGKVVDELGFPIASASIVLEDTKTEVYTDFDGIFTLVSEKDFYWKVTIASKGYAPETFYVLEGGNAGSITLSLDIDLKDLMKNNTGQIDSERLKPSEKELTFYDR